MACELGSAKQLMLLDTHALIWFSFGEKLATAAQERIELSLSQDVVLVSAVTAWEIGNLVRLRRLHLFSAPAQWFAQATSHPGIRVVSLEASVALASTELPGILHRDPADRFLVATARALNVPIVTRDEHILTYAAAGHVRAVPC